MTNPREGPRVQPSDSNMLEIMFEKLEKLEEKVATKVINEQKETMGRMEDTIAFFESHNDHLVTTDDEVEQ